MAKRISKILFATVPADGHFNPLTGLAHYLQQSGIDVRWYTSDIYGDKLRKLNIPHYPFVKALDVNATNVKEIFPELLTLTDPIEVLNFGLINGMINRSMEYYADIAEIRKSFDFDLVIADSMFSGIPLIKAKMKVPVVAVGVIPLAQESDGFAPYGLAFPPPRTDADRDMYRKMKEENNILLKSSIDSYESILRSFGVEYRKASYMDLLIRQSSILLQIGSPEFEYRRKDIAGNVRFIGALMPYSFNRKEKLWSDPRLDQYKKIIIVTQGTVERNTAKLIEPALEAFKNTDVLVIATTGGFGTAALREKYASPNLIIEDHIPFDNIMHRANVFITNGGYGGTLLSIKHKLPMVAAGVHELKNEVCARIGYFNLGINMQTETPDPASLRGAVEQVMNDPMFKGNVSALSDRMNQLDSNKLCLEILSGV